MYVSTLDPKIVGQVIASFRKQKGVSQEVLSGLVGCENEYSCFAIGRETCQVSIWHK